MNKLIIFGCTLLLIACKPDTQAKQVEKVLSAQEIIDRTIDSAGGKRYLNSLKSFVFRGKNYKGEHNNGSYSLIREINDSLGTIIDVLDSKGFRRSLNGERVIVPDSMVSRYANSVNSVHYFAYLPYGLNDKAVNKKLLGTERIKDKEYHKIQVTFNEEGGGDDFEDVFIYWIDSQRFVIDFLAYKYHTGEGGMRFREAYNPRKVNGIRFVDYNNYKPKNKTVVLDSLGSLFDKNELKLLSKIALEEIEVTLK